MDILNSIYSLVMFVFAILSNVEFNPHLQTQVIPTYKPLQREVLLPLPNLVPHPVWFHITVLVSSKNEIPVILFFAAIMISNVIFVSIYYINHVKCYSYRCCVCSSCTKNLGWVHIYWKSALDGSSWYVIYAHEGCIPSVARSNNFCKVMLIK
jgi:hypothetical protein